MRRKIKSLAKRITARENITAVVMIIAVGGISLALGLAALGTARWRGWQAQKEEKGKEHSAYLDELRKLSGITTELESVPDITAGWKQYENTRYNLSIRYPQNWREPKESGPTADNKYLAKISFVNQESADSKNQKGFDVYVYPSASFSGPEGTDSLVKKNEKIPDEICTHFDDISLGEEGYAAKEVDVKGGDPCYEETFFYSLSGGGYLFNIVPLETGFNISDFDDKLTLIKTDPEFYDIVSTLRLEEKGNFLQASRKAATKIYTPPKARFTSGARCHHKNDKPQRSKQGKGKHMDEDCCPDPDEWPNPRCAYSAKALGIMISR